jgi:hypothetical protein
VGVGLHLPAQLRQVLDHLLQLDAGVRPAPPRGLVQRVQRLGDLGDLLVDAGKLLVQLLRLGLLLGAEILVQLVHPRLEVLPRLGRVEAGSQGQGAEGERGACNSHLVPH